MFAEYENAVFPKPVEISSCNFVFKVSTNVA